MDSAHQVSGIRPLTILVLMKDPFARCMILFAWLMERILNVPVGMSRAAMFAPQPPTLPVLL